MSDIIQEQRIQAAIEVSTKRYYHYHQVLEELGKKDVEISELKAVNQTLIRKIATLENNLKFALELIEAESIPTNIELDTAPDSEAMDPQEWDELCSLFPVKQEETAPATTQIEVMPF